mmetsp:Transcript_7924/g.48942  ORF Transcript_7924/g.48942 Transcript_7924/m.48942 type:complete len:246 (+) Transcript_7924:316-1053(+)
MESQECVQADADRRRIPRASRCQARRGPVCGTRKLEPSVEQEDLPSCAGTRTRPAQTGGHRHATHESHRRNRANARRCHPGRNGIGRHPTLRRHARRPGAQRRSAGRDGLARFRRIHTKRTRACCTVDCYPRASQRRNPRGQDLPREGHCHPVRTAQALLRQSHLCQAQMLPQFQRRGVRGLPRLFATTGIRKRRIQGSAGSLREPTPRGWGRRHIRRSMGSRGPFRPVQRRGRVGSGPVLRATR